MSKAAMKRLLWLAVALWGTVGSQPADGAIQAIATGWYDQSGGHSAGNGNYVVGGFNGTEYRNFFVFDLSAVSGNIVGATLKIPNVGSNLQWSSTYTSYDVTTAISALTAGQTGATGIFSDLGTGTVYASGLAPASYADYTVSLAAAGVAALNSAKGGQFAIGGALSPLTPPLGLYNYTFSTTPASGRPVELTLNMETVPEPATMIVWSLLGAASWLGMRVWRRGHRAGRQPWSPENRQAIFEVVSRGGYH
jgi:hypothetical protein